jgi:hypothetical protein
VIRQAIIGALYTDQGAYQKAESMYVRALHSSEKVLGALHPEAVQDLYSLARLYRRVQGAHDEDHAPYRPRSNRPAGATPSQHHCPVPHEHDSVERWSDRPAALR